MLHDVVGGHYHHPRHKQLHQHPLPPLLDLFEVDSCIRLYRLPPPPSASAVVTTAPAPSTQHPAPRLGQGRVGGHGRCSTYIPETIHPSRGRFRSSAAAALAAAAAAAAVEVGMPEVLGPEERGPWRSAGAPEPSQRPGSLQTPDPAPALQTARQRPEEHQLIGSGETQCTGLGRECGVGCVIGLERLYW